MNTKHQIAILGGGITGLMRAFMLSKAGHKISLYDPKGFPAQNASWLAGGMLAPYSEIEHMDENWIEASLNSIDLWEGFKFNTGFSRKGSLIISHQEDRHAMERFRSILPNEYKSFVTPQNYESGIPEKFKSALYLASEAHVEPRLVMCSLVNEITGTVQYIQEQKDVHDLDGFDFILDCRGMGSGDKELRGVKGEILIVRNPEFSLQRPVRIMHPRYPLYVVPRPDHVFMIGATIIESDESSAVSLRSTMELSSALYSLHPSFGDAEIIEMSAGIRPSYADNLPQIKVQKNVIQINGLFRHGFLLAPILAQSLCDYIVGEKHPYWSLWNGRKNDKIDDQRAA